MNLQEKFYVTLKKETRRGAGKSGKVGRGKHCEKKKRSGENKRSAESMGRGSWPKE